MVAYKRDEIVSVSDISRSFSTILNSIVDKSKEKFAISKNNKLEAVILDIEEYERLKNAYDILEQKEIETLLNSRYYIDGQRLKTGIRFFTPILQPAMDVLKKYNFELPKISNQKGNDYLHVIQSMMGLNKSLTFHIARHSFATLALSHGVPLEDVARMLGHEDVHTTLIYAKILKNTIQQFSSVLQKSIQ